ncbi:MAG: response regulator [Cyanobacteria bacterium P01_A01_bin.83]
MNHLNHVDINQDQSQLFADRLPNILGNLPLAERNSCLKVVYRSVIFFIHFNEGQLIYATNSLAPFERLERHLRRLSNQNPQIANSIIKQPRLKFKNDLRTYGQFPTDYQSIMWLLSAGYVDPTAAITLIRRITREVFESFLCLPDFSEYSIIPRAKQIKELCRFDLSEYIKQCQKRIEAWQAFDAKICSSYERPYLVSVKDQVIGNLTVEQNETICKLLKGLNFRQISAVIDRDELVVAKILYPSILDNNIVVRAPKSPFDQLPNFPLKQNLFETTSQANWRGEDSGFHINSHSKQTVLALEDTCKVAYVDNDPAAHQDLTKYLEQNLFSVLSIQDGMDAFGELIEFEPSLILLSVEMPEINGYELCTLLKNHYDFQSIPIIMVNETPERVNLSKSKRAGAIANLTKPFKREELLNTIWQYVQ